MRSFLILGGNSYREETAMELRAFAEDVSWIHFVCFATRPGGTNCMIKLEHTYYAPNTPRNQLFILRHVVWEDMPWIVVSIPIEERKNMEAVVNQEGLCVKDGVPTLFTPGEIKRFPMDNERVFTLENIPDHPVYRGEEVPPTYRYN